MERIALIEVKLYQKANAYHHKTYTVYNGAHGPIRPPSRPGIPPPRAADTPALPATQPEGECPRQPGYEHD